MWRGIINNIEQSLLISFIGFIMRWILQGTRLLSLQAQSLHRSGDDASRHVCAT